MRHLVNRSLIAVLACGCEQASAPTPCDPLATVVLPVAAGKLRGVGKDAAGTIYLVDQSDTAPSRDRLFMSRGMTLARQRVSGGGESGSGAGSLFILSAGEGAAMFNLEMEMGASGPVKMGLLRGGIPDSKFFTIGVDGEVLQVLAAGDVEGYAPENLPGTFSIEHLGALADGRLILVTAPDVDSHYEDFRLFFGSPDRLIERSMVKVARGSYTSITFSLDGQEATALFGSPLNTFVTSQVTIAGQSQPLTVADAPARPAGATFYCLSPR